MSIVEGLLAAGIVLSMFNEGSTWNDDVGKQFQAETEKLMKTESDNISIVAEAVNTNGKYLVDDANGTADMVKKELGPLTSQAESIRNRVRELNPNELYDAYKKLLNTKF